MIKEMVEKLQQLQLKSHLFSASPNTSTHYDRIWIRDNLYISLAFESTNNKKTTIDIYHALTDLLLKYEWKIDYVIKEKPTEDFKFLHPLYTVEGEEIKESWGWKQNDAIGAYLFHIGRLWDNYETIRTARDLRLINKLVKYLESIEYHQDEDSGMWEENKEIHASSIGACVAGLASIQNIIDIPPDMVEEGYKVLFDLLPSESTTKETDLSLLSLIYPYGILPLSMSYTILENIEKKLCRNKGVIRYEGDKYYEQNGIPASWTMGFPWIAICYHKLHNMDKYKYYLSKSIECLNDNLDMTELYIEDKYPNSNCPLGWSQSLMIVALNL